MIYNPWNHEFYNNIFKCRYTKLPVTSNGI